MTLKPDLQLIEYRLLSIW